MRQKLDSGSAGCAAVARDAQEWGSYTRWAVPMLLVAAVLVLSGGLVIAMAEQTPVALFWSHLCVAGGAVLGMMAPYVRLQARIATRAA